MHRLGACLLLLLFPVCAFAKTPAEVFSIASPSVVVVRALDAQGKLISFGSGVVIAPAQVVTNCHVTNKGARLEVKSGPGTLPASIRYADRERDLCQLAVPGLTAPAVKIGSVKQLKIGARVVALGAPQGLELSLSDGIVSALREAGDASIIQTTAPISPGSSGGGLFDEEGRLIGITTYYLADGQNLNFALPADWIVALPERAKTAKATAFDESAWLLKAFALHAKKDWNALRANAYAWTTANPRSDWAWYFLGVAFAETGQANQAIKAYREALRINPEFVKAWYGLGVVYGRAGQAGQVGQADQAIKAFREALRINPEFAEAWHGLGAVFYGQVGQADQAIKAFREALRINPEDAKAWHGLGIVYGFKGERTQVLEAYRQLRTLDPVLADDFFSKVVRPR
jgi:Flp pilus assembly protein TadD